MRRIISILFLLAILFTIAPVRAQDARPTDQCTAETLTALADSLDAATADARKAIEAGDLQGAIEALEEVESQTQAMKAECAGLSFTAKGDKVVGPVNLAEGVYRVTATTGGAIIADLNAIKGECGEGVGSYLSTNMFIIMPGGAVDGAETLVTSSDCTALIAVSNVQGAWSLTFEKVD